MVIFILGIFYSLDSVDLGLYKTQKHGIIAPQK